MTALTTYSDSTYWTGRRKSKRLDYMCQIDNGCTGESVGGFKIGVEIAYPNSIERNNPGKISKVTDMLLGFKKSFIEFCKSEKSVHSLWLCVDHAKKNISIYTVIDGLDYSLEQKLFNGPFSTVPPIYEGYFIDLQISNLGDRDIEEIIPSDCESEYIRDQYNA